VVFMFDFPNTKKNSKISVDQAVNYDGQAILLPVDPKVGLGDGLSFATFAGEDASSVIIATTPASFSGAVTSHGSKIFEMPSTRKARARLLADWANKTLKKNRQGLIPFILLPLGHTATEVFA